MLQTGHSRQWFCPKDTCFGSLFYSVFCVLAVKSRCLSIGAILLSILFLLEKSKHKNNKLIFTEIKNNLVQSRKSVSLNRTLHKFNTFSRHKRKVFIKYLESPINVFFTWGHKNVYSFFSQIAGSLPLCSSFSCYLWLLLVAIQSYNFVNERMAMCDLRCFTVILKRSLSCVVNFRNEREICNKRAGPHGNAIVCGQLYLVCDSHIFEQLWSFMAKLTMASS